MPSTSRNITPPPRVNESDAQDLTPENQAEEPSHSAYRQQKKCSKISYKDSLLELIKEKSRDDIDEDKSFLMSLVPSFKKLNDEQKFTAKVEFLNVLWRMTFCQPPYHVSNPPQFLFHSNLPGLSAHTSYIGTLSSVIIPSGTHHKARNDFQHQHNQSLQNPYSEFTPSPQHSTSTSSSTPLAHMSPSDQNTLSPLTDSELFELH